MDRRTRIYIFCVVVAFVAAVAVAAAVDGSPIRVFGWLPLLGLAVAAEALEIGAGEESGSLMSFSATAHVAAAILYGPAVAGILAALGVLIVDGSRLAKPRWIVANAAMFGLAAAVAGVAYQLAGGSVGTVSTASGVALVVVVVVRYLTNAAILCCGIALATGERLWAVLRETFRVGIGTGIGEGSLGVLVASGYGHERWVILPFLVPLFAALYMSKLNFERLKRETSDALNAFAQVIDERHPTTARHTERVASYVREFVGAIGLPDRESERLIAAAHYHDLGKVAVDEATLSKVGRLGEEELRAIRRHPRLSARLLAPFHFAQEMALYAELHHERYDGRGYYGVDHSRIPIEAHLLIVADSFDAMTSTRSYRPALTVAEAAEELRDKAGSQFHPLVASAFAAMVEGESPADVLSAQDLACLRREFGRIPMLSRRAIDRVIRLPVLATALVSSTIVAFGLPTGPPVRAVLVTATALVAGVAVLRTVRLKHRSARAVAAVRHGHPAHTALQAGGVDCWACWLVWDEDDDLYVPADRDSVTNTDIDAACLKALRVHPPSDATLPSGRALVITNHPIGTSRLAVGCSRRPSALDRQIIAAVAAETRATAGTGPEPGSASTDATSGPTMVIHLGLFEPVRTTAGHLTAERVVGDAVRAIGATVRARDTVRLLGDDRVGVALQHAEPEDLIELRGRIELAVGGVLLPRRVRRDPIRISVVPPPEERVA